MPRLNRESLPLLSVDSVSKTYGANSAVSQLSISVQRAEIFGLLGPSGCGKTTTLRLILGLETPDQGHIELEGQDITAWPPEQREFGMIFQQYALFTNMNVFENVAFGLETRTRTDSELRARVQRLLALLQLSEFAEKRVDELSAGEKQRVAIARAFAIEPPVLLLDEPLANLDAGLRRHAAKEIRTLIKQLEIAAVYVTHDQSEAFALCDRIAIMSNGRILQSGSPLDIYEHPCQPAVAQFLGFNVFPAKRVPSNRGAMLELETLDGGWTLNILPRSDTLSPNCDRFFVGIRPEDIRIGSEERGLGNSVRATVHEISFAGSMDRVVLNVCGNALEALVVCGAEFSPGEECVIEIEPHRVLAFPCSNAHLPGPTAGW